MNLSEIKRTLAAENIQLTKSLGQNFLHDRNQLQRIVAAAEITTHDQILEIGPGLGALTQRLLEKAPHVLAIETDKRLVDQLRLRFAQHSNLTLVHADALTYVQRQDTDWTDWKLVSNLPYSVASPILVELAKTAKPPERIVGTLQLEVAQRLAAVARDDDYGVLSLLVQLRYEQKAWFRIPPDCFFPVPSIESACVILIRRREPLLKAAERRAFEKIVKRGFSQRRKMMLKLLKADWPMARLERVMADLGIPAQARAETVKREQYVEMARRLSLEDPR
jgi:16S rRNA (adenine1518-N6/adenine1519-N6)-dimethyltransferase